MENHTQTRTTLCRLPVEIKQAIASAVVSSTLPPQSPPPPDGLRDLAALAVTSRLWYAVANPLLHITALALDLLGTHPRDHLETVAYKHGAVRLANLINFYGEFTSQNQTASRRESLLLWAISSRRHDLVRRLLLHVPEPLLAVIFDSRLSVSWECTSGTHYPDPKTARHVQYYATPLHAAARVGDDELVESMLRRGVNVDAEACLPCLCPSPHSRILNDSDPFEEVLATPLHLALAHGKTSTAKLLMVHGALWDRPGFVTGPSGGVTSLHIMAANGATQLINWVANSPRHVLCRNGSLHDWPDANGFSSLHYACLASSKMSEEEGTGRQSARKQAWRLVLALGRLGAILDTRNEQSAQRRLETEKRRLGSAVQNWYETNNSESAWLYRICHWHRDMRYFEFSRDEPIAFAESRGNWLLSRALRSLALTPGR
nr:ankyrin unc44 [Colletotrichum truncatum]KAF6781310.1 ankyrin unc44 [Colletotrichum truncatum]